MHLSHRLAIKSIVLRKTLGKDLGKIFVSYPSLLQMKWLCTVPLCNAVYSKISRMVTRHLTISWQWWQMHSWWPCLGAFDCLFAMFGTVAPVIYNCVISVHHKQTCFIRRKMPALGTPSAPKRRTTTPRCPYLDISIPFTLYFVKSYICTIFFSNDERKFV